MSARTDDQYRSFLDALDDAWRDVAITDWESSFLESNVDRKTFTPAQRASIDRMIEKYGERIEW